ncbi:MAG TPA: ATP-binding protein [Kineosporiaceae bacterium]
MTTVTLTFHPAPEHVRTARLVAVAVARRAGLDEARLDEVRLAVGEVCARAVRRCLGTAALGAVEVGIDDVGPVFWITITDPASMVDGDDEAVSLALVRGLADSVTVDDGPGGGTGGAVCLRWAR